ncbi:DUF952 domain-containing protein [Reichenbachiella ulvae]|uniref:DUF952 domain-containing protein n=1 Tax=Reichenbachiella ulvae TaxID=2980104 RepID=A0ABT3CPZ7_9BACT|nr:DUF952 domain-containing protein [Reichenbachiella ulvae]MCV9385594.1 DUF952 domain-containing protein [Reichenbachiella ulvae]
MSKEGDIKNRLILYPSKIQILHKGKSTVIEWSHAQSLQIQSKKLIIALVLGGIGTSFSMLALPLGWYNYNLNLFSIFFFFAVMYWGFIGQKALVIEESKHQHVFLLWELNPKLRAAIKRFYQRKRNKSRPSTEMIFHLVDRQFWESQTYDANYSHPSLESEGFIHCSVAGELAKSYELYFEASAELVLLAIDPKHLDNKVEWEYVEAREASFPHVMGTINKTAIHSALIFQGEEKLKGLLGNE